MGSFPWIVLTLAFILNSPFVFGCCTTSCSSCCSNCQQQCRTSECVNTCQSNCCQQTQCCQSSSCCSSCQQQCKTSECVNTCQSNCCTGTGRSDDCCSRTKCAEIDVVTRPTPDKVIGGGGSGGGAQISSSDRSDAITANIHSTNIINNDNRINMSINVNSDVQNNISNRGGAGAGGGGGGGTSDVTIKEVPVKVPVCGPNCGPSSITPVPPPPPPQQPPTGCCIVVVPCVTYGCNQYRYQCHGCHGQYGYMPVNPCQGGCMRRPTWNRQSCTMGHCMTRTVDCSYCEDDFYQTFEGYSRCHGCFYGGY